MTLRMPVEFQASFDVIVVGAGHAGCEMAISFGQLAIVRRFSQVNLASPAKINSERFCVVSAINQIIKNCKVLLV